MHELNIWVKYFKKFESRMGVSKIRLYISLKNVARLAGQL